MSISNRHTVVPFVAGKTSPMANQRLAKVGYKTTAKNPAKFPSIAVSIPKMELTIQSPELPRLLPHLVGVIESAQDGIIRSLYESSDGSLKEVSDDDISIGACIAFLEAEAAGERLKKEHIESWFDAELKDALYVLVAEKLGFDEPNSDQDAVIQKHVKIYRDVLSMLAGGKTLLTPVQIKGCKTALNLTDIDGGIGQKLMTRLISMEAPKITAEMLEL